MRVAGNDRYACRNGAARSSDKSAMDKDRSNLRAILNICMSIFALVASQCKRRKWPSSTKSTLILEVSPLHLARRGKTSSATTVSARCLYRKLHGGARRAWAFDWLG